MSSSSCNTSSITMTFCPIKVITLPPNAMDILDILHEGGRRPDRSEPYPAFFQAWPASPLWILGKAASLAAWALRRPEAEHCTGRPDFSVAISVWEWPWAKSAECHMSSFLRFWWRHSLPEQICPPMLSLPYTLQVGLFLNPYCGMELPLFESLQRRLGTLRSCFHHTSR